MQPSVAFNQGSAPHLKNEISFVSMLARQLGALLILLLASFWMQGLAGLLLFTVVLVTALASEVALQFLKFSAVPKWDLALVHQAVLLTLFVPALTSPALIAITTFAMTFFYRASGGRGAYVLQPVCLALAFLSALGVSPAYALQGMTMAPSAVLFALWAALRFPRTRVEAERFICVLTLALLLTLLHEMPIGPAFLWAAAAGEILFDYALAPLSSAARTGYRVFVLILFAFFLAVTRAEEALLFTGLTAGFIGAWIEKKNLTGRAYGKA